MGVQFAITSLSDSEVISSTKINMLMLWTLLLASAIQLKAARPPNAVVTSNCKDDCTSKDDDSLDCVICLANFVVQEIGTSHYNSIEDVRQHVDPLCTSGTQIEIDACKAVESYRYKVSGKLEKFKEPNARQKKRMNTCECGTLPCTKPWSIVCLVDGDVYKK